MRRELGKSHASLSALATEPGGLCSSREGNTKSIWLLRSTVLATEQDQGVLQGALGRQEEDGDSVGILSFGASLP